MTASHVRRRNKPRHVAGPGCCPPLSPPRPPAPTSGRLDASIRSRTRANADTVAGDGNQTTPALKRSLSFYFFEVGGLIGEAFFLLHPDRFLQQCLPFLTSVSFRHGGVSLPAQLDRVRHDLLDQELLHLEPARVAAAEERGQQQGFLF